jgi:DNA end-binding protein Ku
VGKLVLRATGHLAALTLVDDALVLNLLRLADDVVKASQLDVPPAKEVRPKELELATLLIDKLAASWDPTKHHDEYRAKLMRVIRAKMKGKEIPAEDGAAPEDTAVVDLMERLRQSLAKSPRAARARTRRGPTTHKRRASRAAA